MPDPTVDNPNAPSPTPGAPSEASGDAVSALQAPNRPFGLMPLPLKPDHTEDTSPTCIPSAYDMAELDDDEEAPTSEDESFFGAVKAVRRELAAASADVTEPPGAPAEGPVPTTFIDDLDDPMLDVGPVFLAAGLLTAGLIGVTWFLITLL